MITSLFSQNTQEFMIIPTNVQTVIIGMDMHIKATEEAIDVHHTHEDWTLDNEFTSTDLCTNSGHIHNHLTGFQHISCLTLEVVK